MKRRETRTVMVGNVPVGGAHPVVLQSMTNTGASDAEGTARQAEALVRAGARIVRFAVPSLRAVESVARAREILRAAGVEAPLVADVHFAPAAAVAAAEVVEKVRINPGNFTDRPDRTEPGESFERGASRAAEALGPLVEALRRRGGALRIGVNHGSLSARMCERHGDTPEGMVESALEYIRICERLDYREIIVSLKSSIPAVTAAANRLFAEKVDREGGRYPLHLGVTEAGLGGEGRLRSAAGIGALLAEGLGDTVRVSLTEDPVEEIPAARAIVAFGEAAREEREAEGAGGAGGARETAALRIGGIPIGGGAPFAVMADGARAGEAEERPDLLVAGSPEEGAALASGGAAFLLRSDHPSRDLAACAPAPAGILFDYPFDSSGESGALERALAAGGIVPLPMLRAGTAGETAAMIDRLLGELPGALRRGAAVGAPEGPPADMLPALEEALASRDLGWPVVAVEDGARDPLERAARSAGPLLAGLASALWIRGAEPAAAFDLLQATRRRLTLVEYISCPCCGRTTLDVEAAVRRVRARTSHLENLKIAVMGCVVNGPGEMADADFGYVGSGRGRVDLYEGKEKVERGVPEEEAVERLVELLKARGRWREE